MTKAFILAAALGMLSSRRIADGVEIILPPNRYDSAKLEASRREWLRTQDEQREAARRQKQHIAETRRHGSDREARRRRRQIERGQLKAENGLAR